MIKDNIKRLCKKRGMTISALEKILGFSNYAIAKWDKSTPKIDSVKKVADFFGVSVDYLLMEPETGEALSSAVTNVAEQMAKEQRHSQRRESDNDADLILEELSTILKNYGGTQLAPETRKIPIVSTIKCGDNGIAYEDIDGYIMVDESLHGDLLVLRTQGESMVDAGINEGDLAIIRIQDDIESGEIAAALIDGEEATLKRVVKLPIGIALEGANPSYKTRYFTGNDVNRVRIIGKLVEVRKRF